MRRKILGSKLSFGIASSKSIFLPPICYQMEGFFHTLCTEVDSDWRKRCHSTAHCLFWPWMCSLHCCNCWDSPVTNWWNWLAVLHKNNASPVSKGWATFSAVQCKKTVKQLRLCIFFVLNAKLYFPILFEWLFMERSNKLSWSRTPAQKTEPAQPNFIILFSANSKYWLANTCS